MDLSHEFTVPLSPAETWDRFQDIAALAECFPGAQVTAVEGDTFTGSVKVKLGPIALVYAGSGTFTERDETARRLVVEAKGRDKRGNGTAGATATLTMSEDGAATRVQVATELSITGKPAQFGRGVLQDVSDKLLGEFVACLESRAADTSGAEPDASIPEAPGPPDEQPVEATTVGSADVGAILLTRYRKVAMAAALLVVGLVVLKLLRRHH